MERDAAIALLAEAHSKANLWAGRFEDAVVGAYEAGASLREIAELLGRTVEGVRQLLLRRGVELRPPHVH